MKTQQDIDNANIIALAEDLLNNIKTTHLDMSGKHRYAISHDAYKIIEPLRQLLNDRR